jgi:D-alanyl-D-alanine carboxypeptidase
MLALLLTCLTLLVRGESIDAALARPELKGARVAFSVVDTATGERVYARNIDEPMTPASNMKLLTAAAALSLLGSDAHFSTRLLAAARPDADGVLHGDLIIVGGGDPCLRADLLAHEPIHDPAALLLDLAELAGVRRVTGRLLVDDGLMDHEWVHPDWPESDVQNTYGAPVGALSLHGNCLEYVVEGGASPSAAILTAASGFRLRNELRLADKSSTCRVGALLPDDQGLVRVQGEVGRAVGLRTLSVPVRDPRPHAAWPSTAGWPSRPAPARRCPSRCSCRRWSPRWPMRSPWRSRRATTPSATTSSSCSARAPATAAPSPAGRRRWRASWPPTSARRSTASCCATARGSRRATA